MLKKLALTAVATFCLTQAAQAGDVNKLLNYVPSDASIVFTLDLDALRGSPLKGLVDFAATQAKAMPDYAEVTKQLKFDPISDLKAISAYQPKGAGLDNFCVFIQGPFTANTPQAFLALAGADASKVQKRTSNGTDIYSISDGALAITSDVAVFCPKTEMVDQALAAKSGKLAKSEGIHKQALANAKSNILTLSASIGEEQSQMVAGLAGGDTDVRGGTLALSTKGADLKLVATGRFADEATAKTMSDELTKQVTQALADPEITSMGLSKDDIKIVQVKKTVALQANIKSGLINMLTSMVQMMMAH